MNVLRRDYLPSSLYQEINDTQIEGVISVQAQQSVAETERLLEHARSNPWIRGVVGWLPLADPSIEAHLDRLATQDRLKGVRHVVQDEPDDGFLSQPSFHRGIALLERYGLVYDILILARQLPFVIPFVDRHPDQIFVLDHIAKPTVRSEEFDHDWSVHLRELAQRPNVYCKFSGVVTEVRDATWSVATLQPYWDVAIEAFTSKRLMFGSDWPVCLLKSSYADWVRAVRTLSDSLSDSEQSNFWGQTASKAYRLG